MKKLLKSYDLNSDQQYYEMIVTSVINGQRTQAREQFKAMPKANRKEFVISIFSSWKTGLGSSDKAMFINQF